MKDLKMNKMKQNMNLQSKANRMAQGITKNQSNGSMQFSGFKKKKKK